MKRFLTLVSALVVSGAVLQAQEVSSTKDTLVVVIKHESGEGFFETVGKPFKKGYKAVENAVVNGYQSVEDAFVETFTDSVKININFRRGYRPIWDYHAPSLMLGVSHLRTDSVSGMVCMSVEGPDSQRSSFQITKPSRHI